jgi:hypothetical protein
MPRVTITVSLVDDENHLLSLENWSPLSYEDLGNPNLAVIEGTLVNGAERNLLERLRTSIDRTLLSFARRERRRFRAQEAPLNPDIQPIFEDNDAIFQQEYMGEFLQPEPETLGVISQRLASSVRELTESQRMAIIADQPMVEDQRVPEPKKTKRVRPIRRVSRYKRDPVI